jgi:hypothetical protein
MDYFKLSRNWFDWCFENPEKIKPVHTALYFFCIEHCNRLGWKQNFGLPTTMVKEAIGIHSYNTFINTLNDLVSFGAIELIQKSQNQYSSNIIAISNFDKANNKALDKALIKHSTKQGESTVQSIDSIDIQYTINNKQETIERFDEFRKLYQGTKKGLNTEFETFKKHKDYKECINLLLPALQKEIEYKQTKKNKGEFVPEWKNLQTWINQRCWEQEFEVIKQQDLPPIKKYYTPQHIMMLQEKKVKDAWETKTLQNYEDSLQGNDREVYFRDKSK